MIKKSIPYGRQNITEEDIQAVTDVLKSDFLTQGPSIASFERAFAKYVGSKFAVAVSNGTAALHLSAMAMNVREGQKVITTPITFSATANCVHYCGGEIVFSDIDPNTYLIDIEKVRSLLERTPKGDIVGIIPVDFAGRAVNLEELGDLAQEFDLWIIEDACHAPGGFFINRKGEKQLCGNGKYADLSVFSFHPVKHIAAGEGGMITTDDENLYKKLLLLRNHGISKKQDEYKNSIDMAVACNEGHMETWPGWYMEMQELGYNYRLTDMQAALGHSQLKRANDGIERRKEIAETYAKHLNEVSGIIRNSGVVEGHAYHLFVIEIKSRLGLYNFLREHNIYAQIHYVPTHIMPYYKKFGWKFGDMPNAEKYYTACMSLPMYPTLAIDEQHFVIDKIKLFYLK